MNIEVIDAFGSKVGDASVEFVPVANPGDLEDNISQIFPAETTVLLPTHDERCPWRLVVRP
jgi:hypothetical protein